MNIFVLDESPALAAEYHCQKHLVKMILEHAQLMSTTINILGERAGIVPSLSYKTTHKNHPCAIWARTSRENFDWLASCTQHLLLRYSKWSGKVHKSTPVIESLMEQAHIIPSRGITEFAQAMPDDCKVGGDAVLAYRRYYVAHKKRMCEWKDVPVPKWYTPMAEAWEQNNSWS